MDPDAMHNESYEDVPADEYAQQEAKDFEERWGKLMETDQYLRAIEWVASETV